MFNHAHAQFRNVIERAYGVLKVRFPILKQMAPYSFTVQKDIVILCVAVHNFIRKYNIQDDLFTNLEEDTMVNLGVQGGGTEGQNVQDIEWGSEAIQYMTTLRNQIANRLLSPGDEIGGKIHTVSNGSGSIGVKSNLRKSHGNIRHLVHVHIYRTQMFSSGRIPRWGLRMG
ncbi:hypothetical protein LXL04_033776 [Taraxacum kok-saghyz]